MLQQFIIWFTVVAVLDLILCIITASILNLTQSASNPQAQFYLYPYLNSFIRPVIVTLQVRVIRGFWKRYILVIKGSFAMVLFILCYIFYFAWMGNRLFSGTIEGVQNFATLGDSFFYMFVLLTTSNFPDVMLPAYGQNRWQSAFFIIYLALGLFIFMNLLLAIFYSSYQEKADESLDHFKDGRNRYFVRLFRQYDDEETG